jgi:cellulose synthase/poly-beta-1,6-N-acetylglucosamine synthase-like glycosyltransferase
MIPPVVHLSFLTHRATILTAARKSSHCRPMARLTIVVPALDEAPIIIAALQALAPLRTRGAEIIVVDGGSRDGTPAL